MDLGLHRVLNADDVGNINQPDRPAGLIDDGQFADFTARRASRRRARAVRRQTVVAGERVMTSASGPSIAASRLASSSRARSLSVKIPTSMPGVIGDHDRAGAPAGTALCDERFAQRLCSAATRHCAQRPHRLFDAGQLAAQAAARMKAGKVRGRKCRSRLRTSASASPSASIAVVLAVGARPSGQASRIGTQIERDGRRLCPAGYSAAR